MPSALVPDSTDHKPTVLIVDDEAAPRAALTQILNQDFHILTADNARAALAVLDDHGVDLVTLDLKLPDRSGSDLLHDIKRAHAEIEVIMVTAYGSLQSAMDCIRHGAAGFLLKPFNASELLAISLQTAQKKLRLDQLRPVLTNSTTLWGPEPACTKAVSDKIFEPSPWRRWLAAFWNSGARLGFVSAAMLSASLVLFALKPAPAPAPMMGPPAARPFGFGGLQMNRSYL